MKLDTFAFKRRGNSFILCIYKLAEVGRVAIVYFKQVLICFDYGVKSEEMGEGIKGYGLRICSVCAGLSKGKGRTGTCRLSDKYMF